MNKFFSFLVAACFSLSASATIFNFDSDASTTQTVDGFTVTLGQGANTGSAPKWYDNGMRLYAQNTITVSGEGITSIEIAFTKQGSKAYAALTASTGEFVSGGESTSATDVKIDKWTGSGNSIVFTLGASGQRIIKQLAINESINIEQPTDTTGQDKPQGTDTLDVNYVYDEPTEVRVTDETQGYNMQYTFVKNNILVSCTKGAITENYFGCNAENQITFTATKAIKGLTIKGFVKKGFDATASKGELTYKNAPDDDETGDPVLVITDLDTTTVTLTCAKQLRCYSVKFYFEENPTDTVDGGISGTGEVFFLDFNAADAVYESLYSEEGDLNYTVYLYTDTIDYPYIGLDLYTATEGELEGVHELGEYSFYAYGEGEYDYVSNVEGQVAITKNGDIYTISGYITCDDKNTYNFSFTGEMPFYTDEEYYGGDDEGIENVQPLDTNAPMYDLLGRRIGKGYQGIVIQNGAKYLVH